MSVPYRTFVLLGVAVGMLGAGYMFVPQPGATTLSTASVAKPAPVAASAPAATAEPVAPATKTASALVVNRPPVPLVTRTHGSYFVPKEEPKPATAEAPAGTPTTTTATTPGTQVATATVSGAPGTDGVTVLKGGDNSKAKAAIELDGYKNVRELVQGPDGIWRGRAMRGRTEIAIAVDATGSVSAQ